MNALTPYLTTEEASDYTRLSLNTIRNYAQRRTIPHFKRPGSHRCLFRIDWLEAWMSGAPLEVTELPDGGREVRPVYEEVAA